MKQITDRQMFAAAVRRLNEHLSTRPATRIEAAQIATREREQAAALRTQAAALPRTPSISSMIERGERGQHVIEMGHELGRAENARVKERSSLENDARCHDLRAESWDTVAATAEGAVWEATRKEFEDRVEFYRALARI